jgi:hypothetical protein
MNQNKAALARKKSLKAYVILTIIFVLIFGGITLLAFFISKLN